MTMSNSFAVQKSIRRRSPLAATMEALGAKLGDEHGWDTALSFSSPNDEAQAVRQSVGLADLSQIPKFDLRGNNLDPSFVLDDDAHIWRQRNGQALVTCTPESRATVAAQLDQYAAGVGESSPVYVSDVTPVYAALLLAGPRSAAVLRKLVDLDLSSEGLPNLACTQTGIHHVYTLVARQDLPSVRAYVLFTGREYAEWLWETVSHAGHEFGMQPFGSEAHKVLGVA
jgi:glycine cleavage system aminomethyltransferase T